MIAVSLLAAVARRAGVGLLGGGQHAGGRNRVARPYRALDSVACQRSCKPAESSGTLGRSHDRGPYLRSTDERAGGWPLGKDDADARESSAMAVAVRGCAGPGPCCP